MNKYFLSTILSLTLFSVVVLPVSAATASSSAAPKASTVLERLAQRKASVDSSVEKLKAQIATREAALKKRLDTFKDAKKAERVQKINDQLNTINQNQTARMTKGLNTFTTILNRLEPKASGSADASASATALESAQTAIANAQVAVASQSAKDYTLKISTESAAKTEAATTVTQLKTDLKVTDSLVKTAKEAVINAIKVVLGGIN